MEEHISETYRQLGSSMLYGDIGRSITQAGFEMRVKRDLQLKVIANAIEKWAMNEGELDIELNSELALLFGLAIQVSGVSRVTDIGKVSTGVLDELSDSFSRYMRREVAKANEEREARDSAKRQAGPPQQERPWMLRVSTPEGITEMTRDELGSILPGITPTGRTPHEELSMLASTGVSFRGGLISTPIQQEVATETREEPEEERRSLMTRLREAGNALFGGAPHDYE